MGIDKNDEKKEILTSTIKGERESEFEFSTYIF